MPISLLRNLGGSYNSPLVVTGSPVAASGAIVVFGSWQDESVAIWGITDSVGNEYTCNFTNGYIFGLCNNNLSIPVSGQISLVGDPPTRYTLSAFVLNEPVYTRQFTIGYGPPAVAGTQIVTLPQNSYEADLTAVSGDFLFAGIEWSWGTPGTFSAASGWTIANAVGGPSGSLNNGLSQAVFYQIPTASGTYIPSGQILTGDTAHPYTWKGMGIRLSSSPGSLVITVDETASFQETVSTREIARTVSVSGMVEVAEAGPNYEPLLVTVTDTVSGSGSVAISETLRIVTVTDTVSGSGTITTNEIARRVPVGDTITASEVVPTPGGNRTTALTDQVEFGESASVITPTSAWTITVRNLDTGLVVSGATVKLQETGQELTTNSSGQVTFSNLPWGTYTWYAWLTGYLVSWDCSDLSGAHTTWLIPDSLAGYVPYCYVDPNCTTPPAADPNPCAPAITDVGLSEDSDGILPLDGDSTYDVTPSLSWLASGGIGPYLFLWEIRAQNDVTVLATGSTNAFSIQLPPLAYGYYHFRLHVNDGKGRCSLWNDFEFEVIPFPTPVTVVTPVTPALVPDSGRIRYLPQWMCVFGTPDTPGSETLLYELFDPILQNLATCRQAVETLALDAYLLNVPTDLPRLGWALVSELLPQDAFVVTVQLGGSGSVLTGDVRRAISGYDFVTAYDPVYLIGAQGEMVFRNLLQRDRMISPDENGLYWFTGETSGLVLDADVIYSVDGNNWFLLTVDSGGLDPVNAVAMLPATVTGVVEFRYQSRLYEGNLALSLAAGNWQPPTRIDIWNRFDELGILAGVRRRPDEDNGAFRTRTYARFCTPPGDNISAVTQQIAEDLALADVLSWDGVSTLNLAASGYWGVQAVYVLGMPQTGTRHEQLLPTGISSQFTASKTEWLPGAALFINRIPISTFTYPQLVTSGSIIDFGTNLDPTSQIVTATFQYPNYELTTSSLGTITQVTPVAANVTPGIYPVILVRGIQAHTLDDPTFIQDTLLTPAGNPNGYFLHLRNALLTGSTVNVGRSSWGNAYWFAANEPTPLASYLPIVFDETS